VIFAAATFALVLLIIVGFYWVLVVRPETESQSRLHKRLKASVSHARAKQLGVLKEVERLSAVGPVNAALERLRGLSDPLQRLIEQSGLRLTVGTLILACGLIGLIGFLLVAQLTRFALLAFPAGALCAMVPYSYVRWKRTRRMRQFEEHFPEAIDLIARALRAGHAFTTGLGMVADEAPEPVRSEFRTL
jgi:tight adherence protein B